MFDAIGRAMFGIRRDEQGHEVIAYKSAVVEYGGKKIRRDLTITITGATNRHLRRRQAKLARMDAKRHKKSGRK